MRVVDPTTRGKGLGKGPPPPAGRPAARPSASGLTVKVKTTNGELNETPFTIVTTPSGSRSMHLRDGSTRPLPAELKIDSGNWFVMNESAASIFAAETTSTASDSTLEALLQQYPRLEQYVHAYREEGLPVKVMKIRVSGELGTEVAQKFTDFLTCGQVGDGSAFSPTFDGSLFEQHGRLGDPAWPAPKLATRCFDVARPGFNSRAAHEYLDDPHVLQAKIKLLAQLLRKSKRTVIYAGAGLSTGAGISDYATRAGSESVVVKEAIVKPVLSPFCAKPSVGHRALAALANENLIWRFIQQNHDGLPQKAGVPQGVMNEIHGGWFDPSNPVVAMKGDLRSDLFDDLLLCEKSADLVLTLGSSLCGMNADRVVSTCAEKALADCRLGSVIVSLQRTPHDEHSSLRIFAKIDDVMSLLVEEMGLTLPPVLSAKSANVDEIEYRPLGPEIDVFLVPYDDKGFLVRNFEASAASAPRRTLDLREGAVLTIAVGSNIGAKASVIGRNADGHWRIGVTRKCVGGRGEFQDVRLLGNWWAKAMCRGEVRQIPLV